MKYLLTAVSVILATILQVTVFPSIPYLGTTPNILLVITVSFSIMYGQMHGLFTGLICGMILDFYTGTLPGYNAMIFACIGFINGSFTKTYDYEDYKLPAFVIILSDLVYGVVVYVTSFMIGGGLSPQQALVHVIIPEVVFTGLVTVFLYPVLIYFERRAAAHSRGRTRKFTSEES